MKVMEESRYELGLPGICV